MCFNIGVIIGPILGGLLADPAGSYPKIFGHIKFLQRFPYAPPNILSAFFLFSAALGVFFGLSEVCLPAIPVPNNLTNNTRPSNLFAIKTTSEQNAAAKSPSSSAPAPPSIYPTTTPLSQQKKPSLKSTSRCPPPHPRHQGERKPSHDGRTSCPSVASSPTT
jgi:MFS family permease